MFLILSVIEIYRQLACHIWLMPIVTLEQCWKRYSLRPSAYALLNRPGDDSPIKTLSDLSYFADAARVAGSSSRSTQ
jgi:hypothetical protein